MHKNKGKSKVKSAKRPDPTNAEILRLETQLLSANVSNRELLAKLNASRKTEALFTDLADIIRSEARSLKVPANFKLVPSGSGDSGEFDLVLILSDEHADQVISHAGSWGLEYYDFNIFRCRLQRLLEQIIRYVAHHLPRHRFVRLWVLKLGDSVNGDIHGAGPQNHFGNTIKAALATGDAEAQFVAALTPYFPEGIHVVAVSGNHPRRTMRKNYGGPHDNFDYLVVSQMASRLSDYIDKGMVTVHAPEAWTAFVNIRGYLWALNHGDDVKGFAGHPWYGFDRKNNKVQALVARFDQKIDFFAYGHYHTEIKYPSGGATSIHSGAFPMCDVFSLNAISSGNEPVQSLFALHEEHGITLTMPIRIRDEASEAKYRAGKHNPTLGQHLLIDQITPPSRDAGFRIHNA